MGSFHTFFFFIEIIQNFTKGTTSNKDHINIFQEKECIFLNWISLVEIIVFVHSWKTAHLHKYHLFSLQFFLVIAASGFPAVAKLCKFFLIHTILQIFAHNAFKFIERAKNKKNKKKKRKKCTTEINQYFYWFKPIGTMIAKLFNCSHLIFILWIKRKFTRIELNGFTRDLEVYYRNLHAKNYTRFTYLHKYNAICKMSSIDAIITNEFNQCLCQWLTKLENLTIQRTEPNRK